MATDLLQNVWNKRAKAVLPDGGFGNFDPSICIRESNGSRVWDEDGKEYVDYLMGSGPMILGHGHPEVIEAVQAQLTKGMTYFANNASGIELAEEICRAVPCAEKLRYVCTGGEADMYAMRLARAFTGRNRILKFEGGYHGMSADAQMSLAPTRLVNFPQAVPDSAGIPSVIGDDILVAPFNDAEAVQSIVAEHADSIAGIIVEPLQRLIPPAPDFLPALRKVCDQYSIVLIFDEIVTGFRLSYGGAQELYDVTPDICTLGKIIGGGFPLAAIAGRADIMAHFDKQQVGQEGFLMQLGTLSGNPVAAVAGLKTLEILRRPGMYEQLRQTGSTIMSMLETRLDDAGIAHRIVGDPTLFDVVFTDKAVNNYRDVFAADAARNAAFNKILRANGILKSPGKCYPSLAVNAEDLAVTDRAIERAAADLQL